MTDYQPKSDFLRIIRERGFFHQCTDLEALDKRLMRGDPVSAYIGFDATADSLHVGSLMQIMMLRWLQKCGHRPIVLMGGGTTKVGDPSGKDETRQLLDTKAINKNIRGIMGVFDKYISFGDGATDAIQPNNANWLDKLNYVEFLRDIGRHFTINKMMTMESVKTRLEREQPLTFLEFNYMLLQSYDYLQLHQREGCELQIGGSDQWGNIVNGIDLVRRVDSAQVFGLTSPLLTKADGSKMGKTAYGAVWLSEFRLASYDFWQFWRNTLDADVGRFLKLYTELPVEECDRIGALQGEEINEAKIILANEVCTLCHGRDSAKAAEKTAREVFEKGGTGNELPSFRLGVSVFQSVKDPSSKIILRNTIDPIRVLIHIKFAASGKEAKRLIASGGVRINDEVITDPQAPVYVPMDEQIKISIGKKRHTLVSFFDDLKTKQKLIINT